MPDDYIILSDAGLTKKEKHVWLFSGRIATAQFFEVTRPWCNSICTKDRNLLNETMI